MARRSNQKLKLLYLSKILLEQTDDKHGLTLSQISNELSKYGIEAGRKSLYDDMEALRVYGLDVRTKRDRYVRYYIENREFEKAELMLLCDLISQSGILTEKKSNELLRKLKSLGAVNNDSESVAVPKALTEDAYKSLEVICNAISKDKRISFRCFEWNSRKQRILLNGGESFTVSPHKLIFENGKYLLKGFDHTSKTGALFSVDKLLDVALLNKKREVPRAEYVPSAANEQSNLRLRCDNSSAGDIFERFGINVTILSNRDEYFEVSVKTGLNNEFFAWIFRMGGRVSILAPHEAAEQYEKKLVESIKNARLLYEKE